MDDLDARTAVADVLGEIAPEVDLRACDATRPFVEELDLDSMDVLALLAGLAERTGVEVPDAALSPGWSLDDLVAVLLASSATETGT